ncbi:MAG: VanZ family protein [Chloroflexi bacterium]|nr:VanZ family protein [Chloroflexota bacterium]
MRVAVNWLAVGAWMSIIFILSAQPHLRVTDDDGLDILLRKAGHLFAFGTLAVLLFEALPSRTEGAGRTGRAFVLAVLYAVTDEVHQAFVAGRAAAATDVLIDAIGAGIALLAWARAKKLTSQRRG